MRSLPGFLHLALLISLSEGAPVHRSQPDDVGATHIRPRRDVLTECTGDDAAPLLCCVLRNLESPEDLPAGLLDCSDPSVYPGLINNIAPSLRQQLADKANTLIKLPLLSQDGSADDGDGAYIGGDTSYLGSGPHPADPSYNPYPSSDPNSDGPLASGGGGQAGAASGGSSAAPHSSDPATAPGNIRLAGGDSGASNGDSSAAPDSAGTADGNSGSSGSTGASGGPAAGTSTPPVSQEPSSQQSSSASPQGPSQDPPSSQADPSPQTPPTSVQDQSSNQDPSPPGNSSSQVGSNNSPQDAAPSQQVSSTSQPSSSTPQSQSSGNVNVPAGNTNDPSSSPPDTSGYSGGYSGFPNGPSGYPQSSSLNQPNGKPVSRYTPPKSPYARYGSPSGGSPDGDDTSGSYDFAPNTGSQRSSYRNSHRGGNIKFGGGSDDDSECTGLACTSIRLVGNLGEIALAPEIRPVPYPGFRGMGLQGPEVTEGGGSCPAGADIDACADGIAAY